MEQLLTHILGDYVLQSDWMAMNKSKRTWPCLVHVLIYTSVFLFLTTSWKALLVIGVVHFFLDRFHTPLKRFIWMRQHLGPFFLYVPYGKCNATGYYDNLVNEATNVPKENWEKEHECKYHDPHDANDYTVTYGARLNYITIWLYIVHDNFLHLLTNYLALKYLT